MILEAIGSPKGSKLTPDQLLRTFSVLVDFRNICAHDERLCCAKVGKSHDIDFSQMVGHLSRVLPANEFDRFITEIFNLFDAHKGNLHVVTPASLLNKMGFALTDKKKHESKAKTLEKSTQPA